MKTTRNSSEVATPEALAEPPRPSLRTGMAVPLRDLRQPRRPISSNQPQSVPTKRTNSVNSPTMVLTPVATTTRPVTVANLSTETREMRPAGLARVVSEMPITRIPRVSSRTGLTPTMVTSATATTASRKATLPTPIARTCRRRSRRSHRFHRSSGLRYPMWSSDRVFRLTGYCHGCRSHGRQRFRCSCLGSASRGSCRLPDLVSCCPSYGWRCR